MRVRMAIAALFVAGVAAGALAGYQSGIIGRASNFGATAPPSRLPGPGPGTAAPPVAHGQFRIYPYGAQVATLEPAIPAAAAAGPTRQTTNVAEVLGSPLAVAPRLVSAPGYHLTRASATFRGGAAVEVREVFEGGGPPLEIIRIPVGNSPVPVNQSQQGSGISVEKVVIAGIPAVVTSGKAQAPFRLQFITGGVETIIDSTGLKLSDVQPYVEKALLAGSLNSHQSTQ